VLRAVFIQVESLTGVAARLIDSSSGLWSDSWIFYASESISPVNK